MNLWLPDDEPTKANNDVPFSKMTVEQMIDCYNLHLIGHGNYIKALEQEEKQRLAILKMFGCDSEEQAIDNIKAFTSSLNILGEAIIKAGYVFSKDEALEGIRTNNNGGDKDERTK